jgi:hypothetical protein
MGGAFMREWLINNYMGLAVFIVGVMAFWLIVARNRFAYGKSSQRAKAPFPAQSVEIVSASYESQDGMPPRVYLGPPYERVNDKAAAIKGVDERAIRELADAVLQLITSVRPPSAILRPFMERVAQGEINYRSGRITGIPEANVVRVVDYLAAKLGAPGYARTDEDEVRAMRLDISQIMPNFIPRRPLRAGEEALAVFPYTVDPLMSPIEAVYVTHHLITQKEFSEFSLLTSHERADVRKAVNKLKERGVRLTLIEQAEVMRALTEQKLYPNMHQLTAEELAAGAQQLTAESWNNRSGYSLQFGGTSTPRYREMKRVFDRAYRMKVTDAMELASKSIDLLGV